MDLTFFYFDVASFTLMSLKCFLKSVSREKRVNFFRETTAYEQYNWDKAFKRGPRKIFKGCLP